MTAILPIKEAQPIESIDERADKRIATASQTAALCADGGGGWCG